MHYRQKGRITLKKRQISIVLATVIVASMLGGCSKQATDAKDVVIVEEEKGPAKADSAEAEPIFDEVKALPDIYTEIQGKVVLYSPIEFDDEFLMNYYGIDASLLEEYVFSMSEDATSAETIVLMKVKEIGDVENLKSALQVVVDEKRNEMENYLPEQFAIVDKAQVEAQDNYIWLVISENENEIKKIIEDGLK